MIGRLALVVLATVAGFWVGLAFGVSGVYDYRLTAMLGALGGGGYAAWELARRG